MALWRVSISIAATDSLLDGLPGLPGLPNQFYSNVFKRVFRVVSIQQNLSLSYETE